jgi:hypothetical protein
MIERIDTKYKRLFELRVFHHYWLDQGNVLFDSLPNEDKERRLLSYDVRSFLALKPTTTTEKALKGFGCVYKESNLGCIVVAPDSVVLPTDTVFEFVVTVKDAMFFNYTALTLRPQKIYELIIQSKDIQSVDSLPIINIYRYKENVPVLSNLTGATRGTGINKNLFLSKEFSESKETDLVESLVLSGKALLQLTSDPPNADTHLLNVDVSDSPVFLNQSDIPEIVPPKDLNSVQKNGILLSSDIANDVFMFIKLSGKREDDMDFNFVDSNGHAKSNYPIFQIRFKSRSTFWQYFKKSNGALDFKESEPLPLTYYGTAGKKNMPKPSDGLIEVNKNENSDRVSSLISNIFI